MAADALRAQGHDVVASADDAMLAAMTDEDLLRAGSREGRAVVTENAKDFDRIVRTMAAGGEHHAGVVITSPRRCIRCPYRWLRGSYSDGLDPLRG